LNQWILNGPRKRKNVAAVCFEELCAKLEALLELGWLEVKKKCVFDPKCFPTFKLET
jgi:hypothetical protein